MHVLNSRQIKRYQFWLLLFLLLIVGCTEESIPADGLIEGQMYYPVETGKSWTYTYDSIVYDLSMSQVINLQGYVKEVVGEPLDDERYVLDRYWRKEESDPWVLTDKWTITAEERRIIKTEENLSFIKLVFPPKNGVSWDGNAFFPEDTEITVAGEAMQPYFGWEYVINETEGEYNNENINASQVVSVTHVDLESLLDRRFSVERYAEGIGMVEKEMMILDCQCVDVDTSIPWEDKAEKGYILRQKLIAYE